VQALEGVHSEKVAREVVADIDSRREAVLRDAPELQNLLGDLAASFEAVQTKTTPLLKELRSGGLGTSEGLSYLETKHTLLLMYCVHSLFYVMLKLEGRPVKNHPVMTRLVETKAFLEKLRPIDKRLKPQIEKLLRAAEVAARGGVAQPTGAPSKASLCREFVKVSANMYVHGRFTVWFVWNCRGPSRDLTCSGCFVPVFFPRF
jgi:U3 small nucleolar RNA-associated protein 3